MILKVGGEVPVDDPMAIDQQEDQKQDLSAAGRGRQGKPAPKEHLRGVVKPPIQKLARRGGAFRLPGVQYSDNHYKDVSEGLLIVEKIVDKRKCQVRYSDTRTKNDRTAQKNIC